MNIEAIKTDYYRYRAGISKFGILKEFFRNKGFRYSVFMRLYSGFINEKKHISAICVKAVWKMLYLNSTIEIPLGVECGEGLYMGHFSGITINQAAKLGKNINIHKGVTIGQENRGKRKGVPTIGNEVWIGINSTIVGNIKIGNNVLIAPNSYVNFDVPDNSIVIGNIIKSNINATEGYVNNKV